MVKAAGRPGPELDALRHEAVAGPERRAGHRSAREPRDRTRRHACSSSSRETSGSLCFDAHAPIWLSRGRVAKYVVRFLVGTRLRSTPSMRTCRSICGQCTQSAAAGCAARSRALRLVRLVKNAKPAIVEVLDEHHASGRPAVRRRPWRDRRLWDRADFPRPPARATRDIARSDRSRSTFSSLPVRQASPPVADRPSGRSPASRCAGSCRPAR